MVGALDGGCRHPRARRREAREVVGRAVLILRADDDERRHVLVLEKFEVVHREGRGDQRHAPDPAVTAADLRGDPRPERVAGDREHAAPDRFRQGIESRRGVILLADPTRVDAAGCADPTEIEAQRGKTKPRAHFLDAHDDRIFHVAAVQWMRVADHDPGRRGCGQGEASFEAQIGSCCQAHGLFGYHVPP